MGLSYERRHLSSLWLHRKPGGADNLVGVVRNLTVNTGQSGNVGAALTPLHSFSVPANTLRNNGDYILLWYSGNFAANANGKTLQASAGGTIYEISATIAPGASGWTMIGRIVRTSPTAIIVCNAFSINDLFGSSATTSVVTTFGDSAFFAARNKPVTGLPDLSLNSLSLVVSGQGVANNDVFQNLSIIEFVQN